MQSSMQMLINSVKLCVKIHENNNIHSKLFLKNRCIHNYNKIQFMQYNSKYTSAIALLIAYVSMNVKKKKNLFRETSAV